RSRARAAPHRARTHSARGNESQCTLTARLELAAIDLQAVDRVQGDPFDATQVDRGHLGPIRHLPEPEWLAAAGRAEPVLDDVAVEGVGGHRVCAGGHLQRRARDEPQQETLPAAVRAVALDGLVDLAVHGKPDSPAMTASTRHGTPPGTLVPAGRALPLIVRPAFCGVNRGGAGPAS